MSGCICSGMVCQVWHGKQLYTGEYRGEYILSSPCWLPPATTALPIFSSGSREASVSPEVVLATEVGTAALPNAAPTKCLPIERSQLCTGMGAFADANGLQFYVEVKWRLSIDGEQRTRSEKTTLNKIKPCLRRTFTCFAWQPYVPKDILIWQAVGPCLDP